jgi:Tfp pilus assembly protein PilV
MSMIETTISLVVLSVGILGMLAAQVTALQQSNHGRHVTEAAQLARDQLEMLQRLPWTHPAVAAGTAWSAPRATTQTVTRANGQTGTTEETFNVSWRVQAGASPNVRRVDVRVLWAEEDGSGSTANRQAYMSTLKAMD